MLSVEEEISGGNKIVYNGIIQEGVMGENSDALFIGDMEEPIAKCFDDDFGGKWVSVSYYISDVEKTKQELMENRLISITGSVEADYRDAYSELTGYLWTDEELKVGGHDLLKILNDNLGKFIYMEVQIHPFTSKP